MKINRPIGVGLLALLTGCAAHLKGSALVDGAPFVARDCRAGLVYGFSGIELRDHDGGRVRLVTDPLSGDVQVALFPPGRSRGVNLGSCGALRQTPQPVVVNGIQLQRGEARFDCHAGGHSASGAIDFAYCH